MSRPHLILLFFIVDNQVKRAYSGLLFSFLDENKSHARNNFRFTKIPLTYSISGSHHDCHGDVHGHCASHRSILADRLANNLDAVLLRLGLLKNLLSFLTFH